MQIKEIKIDGIPRSLGLIKEETFKDRTEINVVLQYKKKVVIFNKDKKKLKELDLISASLNEITRNVKSAVFNNIIWKLNKILVYDDKEKGIRNLIRELR